MMKYVWTRTAAVVITVGSTSAFAATAPGWSSGLRPYVGADVEVRRMDFRGGYGDNLLQHHSPQGNVYAGVKFNDFVGLEFGFEATTTRTRTMTVTTGDVVNGQTIPAAMSPTVFKSKAKIKGPHLDLVGYYSFYENSPLQLLGGVGVSYFKGAFERRTLSVLGSPRSTVRTLSDHKAVLRLTGGLQYWITENWGARLTLGWVNTGKLVIWANDVSPPGALVPAIKPKNSVVYGLGTLWAF